MKGGKTRGWKNGRRKRMEKRNGSWKVERMENREWKMEGGKIDGCKLEE